MITWNNIPTHITWHRSQPRSNFVGNKHSISHLCLRCPTLSRSSSCTLTLYLTLLRKVSSFLQHSTQVQRLWVDTCLRTGSPRSQEVLDLPSTLLQLKRWRAIIHLLGSLQRRGQRSACLRGRKQIIPSLLCEQVIARCRDSLHSIGEAHTCPLHCNPQAATILPMPSNHSTHYLYIEEYTTQTWGLWSSHQMDCRTKWIQHHFPAANCPQVAGG